MRPLCSFVGQPIRSLQTMLRVIAEDDPTHLRIVPDGIYGPETTAAVSTFQRKHGLPVTGVTDHATWEAVVGVYTPALVRIDAAHPVAPVPEATIRPDDACRSALPRAEREYRAVCCVGWPT